MQDPQTPQNRKFKLGFKTPTSLVESVEPLQDVDYFDAERFYSLEYLTACEKQLSKARESGEDGAREVFVDFTNVKEVEDQMFWVSYLRCFGTFTPINLNILLAAGFSKVAQGYIEQTNVDAFKTALKFVDKVGSERAIVVLAAEQLEAVKKLNNLPRELFDSEILLLDHPSRTVNESIFFDIENDKLKIDYFLAISPIMQAIYHTRLDHAEKDRLPDLQHAMIAKPNEKLAIQNIKAFKKLAEGLELTQEDFV